LSPAVLAYVVGPISLAVVVVLAHFELVAGSLWAYAGLIVGTGLLGLLVDRAWPDAPPRVAPAAREGCAACGRGDVGHLSERLGPGPGMRYAFTALSDLQQTGAAAWRAALGMVAGRVARWVRFLVLEGWRRRS